MKHRTIALMGLIMLLLAGCAGLSAETEAPPTLDPKFLSVTPVPSVTPEATYTPYPTTVRLPSETPFPTYEPLVTLIPYTVVPAANVTPTKRPPTVVAPTVTPPIGIPEFSEDKPELATILTFEPITFCSQWFIAQIGVINRGTAAAYDFDVQWSFGWGEPQSVHVDELQWYAGPLWFFSGETAVHCDADATLTAWIKIDTGNTVAESDEGNNNAEETYTVRLGTPAP